MAVRRGRTSLVVGCLAAAPSGRARGLACQSRRRPPQGQSLQGAVRQGVADTHAARVHTLVTPAVRLLGIVHLAAQPPRVTGRPGWRRDDHREECRVHHPDADWRLLWIPLVRPARRQVRASSDLRRVHDHGGPGGPALPAAHEHAVTAHVARARARVCWPRLLVHARPAAV